MIDLQGHSRSLTDFASCAGCAGKLPPGELSTVLRALPRSSDPRLLVGTETADDAGIFQLSETLALVQTIDFFPPVVDDPFVYGQIAAANALSDVYAMGGKPITALNLAGFPEKELPLTLLGEILAGGADKCQEAGCTILGGHTVKDSEIKFGLAVTGTVHPQEYWTNAGAKPGDILVLFKPLGTGLATTAARKGKCPAATYEAAVKSMTRLNRDAAEVCREVGGLHAATDITGFGLAGHAYEMAQGSNVTIELRLTQLPLLPGVLELVRGQYFSKARRTNRSFVEKGMHLEPNMDCDLLEMLFDPQTSGGLLVSLAAEKAAELMQRAQQAGCLAHAAIGEVKAKGQSTLVIKS
ncbi:MAG TPA: selenide, water dikinase SelD [Gemmatales bacterium]|nr:selenide, water dikinase SelD [Gemmatales bacterium]